MKKLLAASALFFALAHSPARAEDYVCQLTLAPAAPDPTFGNAGYIGLYTSKAPNCSGATTDAFICSKGATNHYCGVNAQYSEAALIAIYQTLHAAEVEQDPVVLYWNACINAGGNCVGGAFLYPNF